MSRDWGCVIGLTLGLLWIIPAWHYGKAAGMKSASDWITHGVWSGHESATTNRPGVAPKSCPTRLVDGRNEIRCWLTEGHEGDCK